MKKVQNHKKKWHSAISWKRRNAIFFYDFFTNLSEMIVEDLQSYIPVENKHQLNLLQQRVLRMNALINGLLEYSRVGKQEILLESVNLEELLDEVIDSLDPPKSFKIHYSKPLPTLVTKKLLLNQIIATNSVELKEQKRGKLRNQETVDESNCCLVVNKYFLA